MASGTEKSTFSTMTSDLHSVLREALTPTKFQVKALRQMSENQNRTRCVACRAVVDRGTSQCPECGGQLNNAASPVPLSATDDECDGDSAATAPQQHRDLVHLVLVFKALWTIIWVTVVFVLICIGCMALDWTTILTTFVVIALIAIIACATWRWQILHPQSPKDTVPGSGFLARCRAWIGAAVLAVFSGLFHSCGPKHIPKPPTGRPIVVRPIVVRPIPPSRGGGGVPGGVFHGEGNGPRITGPKPPWPPHIPPSPPVPSNNTVIENSRRLGKKVTSLMRKMEMDADNALRVVSYSLQRRWQENHRKIQLIDQKLSDRELKQSLRSEIEQDRDNLAKDNKLIEQEVDRIAELYG